MNEHIKLIRNDNEEACISIKWMVPASEVDIHTIQKAIGYLSAIHLTKDGAITMTRERGCS